MSCYELANGSLKHLGVRENAIAGALMNRSYLWRLALANLILLEKLGKFVESWLKIIVTRPLNNEKMFFVVIKLE